MASIKSQPPEAICSLSPLQSSTLMNPVDIIFHERAFPYCLFIFVYSLLREAPTLQWSQLFTKVNKSKKKVLSVSAASKYYVYYELSFIDNYIC